MGSGHKQKQLSALEIIKLSLYNFGLRHPQRRLYIALILALTVGRICVYGLKSRTLDQIGTQHSVMYDKLVVILFIEIVYHNMEFLKYFLFEKHLAKFGPLFSSRIMRNLLMCEDRQLLEVPGGQIEYYVTEGSKAMAKISRQIILGFVSKSLYVLMNFYLIYTKDQTANKMLFTISLAAGALITALKVYQVRQTLAYLRQTITTSYEREKVYTEAVDNMQIIKAYGTEAP
ncbi:hypothetical protein PAPHI01_2705, partial [Pancytospora philotis]